MKKFFIFVLLLSSILMFAQNTPNESTWVTNGAVEVILYADGITYIGGDFTQVGPVGGPMTTRNYLAAINASAGIATAWNPNPDAAVFALTAYGTTIFVGGNFRNIGGQPRNRLAAIDVNTGNVTSWNPNANNIVNALEVSGTTIYAGGYFTEIGGISRPYFAQLDASAPTLTTTSITTFDATSALMGGNVTDDGGATVFERGVVYSSTNTNPEIEGTDVTADSNGSGTGIFSESIGSLVAGTTYYVQAYAANSEGTSYGGVQSFTTLTPGLWTGATDTDWHTATNWDDGNVPTATVNVQIPDTDNDPIVSANATCQNITIASSAAVTINSSKILNITGNFVLNDGGSFSNNGTLQFSGSDCHLADNRTTKISLGDVTVENN